MKIRCVLKMWVLATVVVCLGAVGMVGFLYVTLVTSEWIAKNMLGGIPVVYVSMPIMLAEAGLIISLMECHRRENDKDDVEDKE